MSKSFLIRKLCPGVQLFLWIFTNKIFSEEGNWKPFKNNYLLKKGLVLIGFAECLLIFQMIIWVYCILFFHHCHEWSTQFSGRCLDFDLSFMATLKCSLLYVMNSTKNEERCSNRGNRFKFKDHLQILLKFYTNLSKLTP